MPALASTLQKQPQLQLQPTKIANDGSSGSKGNLPRPDSKQRKMV